MIQRQDSGLNEYRTIEHVPLYNHCMHWCDTHTYSKFKMTEHLTILFVQK